MSCIECNYEFSSASTKYYCCQRNIPVCLLCRRKPCKKCHNLRNTELTLPTCDKCYLRKTQKQLLCQYQCGKFYCSKCLTPIFRHLYEKVNQSQQLMNNPNFMVKLYCGDQFLYKELFQYFRNFCVECGRTYQSSRDFQLTDGAKLCSLCIQSYGRIYQHKLLKCLCCQTICREISKTMNLQEAIVCLDCYKESNIQQSVISASRFIENVPVKQNNFVFNQQKQIIIDIEEPPKEKSINTSVKESKLNHLFKKQSLNQLKQKKQAQKASKISENSLEEKTILSKFSSQFQQIQGQHNDQIIKLKRHLSNQTVVENFKIQIKNDTNPGEEFMCQQCGIITAKKCLFKNEDRQNEFQNKNVNKKQDTINNICRCCFANSISKSFFGFSNQLQEVMQRERHVSAPKHKPTSLYQSPLKIKQKQSFKQIASNIVPNTQNNTNLNDRYLKLSSNQNINFGKTSMISATDSKFYQQRKNPMKFLCKLCKQSTSSFVNSISYGQICMNCYYKKK